MRALLLLLVPAIAAADPPTIEPAEIVAVVAKALATVDAKATPGTAVVIAHLEKLDVAKQAPAVRSALAKLAVVEDRSESGTTVITVEGSTKARAVIVLAAERGAISVVAKPTAVKPPGACVAIPNVAPVEVDVHSSAIDDRGDHREGSTFWRMASGRLFDLDGDALADAFVPIAPKTGVCPEDFSYRVYVMRGACGHDLGVVGPGSFPWNAAAVPLDASGYRPLTVEWRKSSHGARGIPELTTTTRTFAVKGTTYKQTSVQTSTGTCHHCGVWHCRKR